MIVYVKNLEGDCHGVTRHSLEETGYP